MSISVLPRRRPLVTDGSIASIHGLEIGAERSCPSSVWESLQVSLTGRRSSGRTLGLNEHLIPHPTSTFLSGQLDSMIRLESSMETCW